MMELVDGPTLAERIEQGPLPLDEALAIARQIADAPGTYLGPYEIFTPLGAGGMGEAYRARDPAVQAGNVAEVVLRRKVLRGGRGPESEWRMRQSLALRSANPCYRNG